MGAGWARCMGLMPHYTCTTCRHALTVRAMCHLSASRCQRAAQQATALLLPTGWLTKTIQMTLMPTSTSLRRRKREFLRQEKQKRQARARQKVAALLRMCDTDIVSEKAWSACCICEGLSMILGIHLCSWASEIGSWLLLQRPLLCWLLLVLCSARCKFWEYGLCSGS